MTIRPVFVLFDFLSRIRRDDRGQATAEYALVLLGAVALAVLFITWATKTGKVEALLNVVFGQIEGQARGS